MQSQKYAIAYMHGPSKPPGLLPGLDFIGSIVRFWKTLPKESFITFSRCIRFWRDKNRWKALAVSFPTVFVSSKTDATRESYERFLGNGFQHRSAIALFSAWNLQIALFSAKSAIAKKKCKLHIQAEKRCNGRSMAVFDSWLRVKT